MDINLNCPDLKAGLYILATPIGNLGDISLRALEVLMAADAVYCEDTRVTGKLLKHYGVSSKLRVYNDHSDASSRAGIIKAVQNGERIVLVSDAGMPLISDPGYKLVCDAREVEVMVTSVPGANAPLTALQISGMPSDQFSFLGFLPSKQKARQDFLLRWADVPSTLIAFETAPRLVAALGDIAAVMPGREVAVVREITKKFEEVLRDTVEALLAHYESDGPPKGEIVLVIGPPADAVYDDAALEGLLREALKDMRTKDAAAHVAAQTGTAKTYLYDMALKIND